MGLTIGEVRLTKYLNEFGRIYFDDCNVSYYDEDNNAYDHMPGIRNIMNQGSE